MKPELVDKPKIQPMSNSELAAAYNVDRKTMAKVLKQIPADKLGPLVGRYYFPKQILIIFDYLGAPPLL